MLRNRAQWLTVTFTALTLCAACAETTPADPPTAEQSAPLVAVEQDELLAGDGAAGDRLGFAVAIDGDTAVVGADSDEVGGNLGQGSAYVFTRNGAVWAQQQKLTAGDGAVGDNFGSAVAISGDTALVGAPKHTVGGNAEQGAAYVFVRNGAVWTPQQTLTASDGAVADSFGWSVAIDGDTALVGARDDDVGAVTNQGSAYVFIRNGAVWTPQQKLTASDGAANDRFSVSVALDGDTALVGAGNDDVGAGSAYVFTRNGAVWTPQQKLTASDGAANDVFGASVALDGDTALVGAFLDDGNGASGQGSAYVFTRNGAAWTPQQKLTASDGASFDNFGRSVALAGDTALVGANAHAVGGNDLQGAAYVFTRSGAVWTEEAEATASNGAVSDSFGWSVALSAGTAVVGAVYHDVGAKNDQGAAYVFVLGKGNGEACGANAECASGFCVDGVCCDKSCGNGSLLDCRACSVAKGAAVDGTCTPLADGTVCRTSAGLCDVAETCDGMAIGCPADAKAAQGTECRAAAGDCDVSETCDGASDVCPSDASAPDGTMCADGTCAGGVCKGSGGSGGNAGAGGSAGPGGDAGAGGADTGGTGGIAGAGGADTGGTGGIAGAGGAGGADTGGSGGSGGKGGTDCMCRAAGTTGETSHAALSLLGVAFLGMRRSHTRIAAKSARTTTFQSRG